MENNIKSRYIYAVTRHLPKKIQADVEQELDSLILEMTDERRGNNAAPNEQDIKDVLAELGPPEELALKYYGSERKAFISGVYFLMYKRVLSIVLPIVAAVLAVLAVIGFFVGEESTGHIVIGLLNLTFMTHAMQVISVIIGGVIQAFAVITVIFAVLEYMKVDIKNSDLNNLPEIPEERLQISPWGPIFGIILAVSTTALLLVFPQVIGIFINFNWIPVFDVEFVRGLWFPILLWAIIEIVAEIVKLIEGQYTLRLAMITVVTGVVQVIFAVTVFRNSDIINSEFLNFVGSYSENFEALSFIFDRVIMQPHISLMMIVLIVLFFDILDVVVKVFQSKRA